MASYDSAWKELLDRFLRLALLFFFPEVEEELDWTDDYESLDSELRKLSPDGAVGDRLADRLVKVRAKGEGDPRLLHFEVQGKKQPGFGRRMYRYNYRAFDALDLPPEALVILADGDRKWKPRTYRVVLKRTTLTFRFEPVKLLDYAGKEDWLAAHENPVGLFVLAHLEALRTAGDDEERGRVKLGLLVALAERKMDEEDTRQWYRFLDWMLELPHERDAEVYRQAQEKMREGQMPFVTFADRYERQHGRDEGLEEGRKEGRKEGRTEGLKEGRTEGLKDGRTEGLKEGLLAGLGVALGIKFGNAGEALLAELARVEDPAVLEAILQRTPTADGPDELRGMLVPDTRPR
jgi:hypothetical protein